MIHTRLGSHAIIYTLSHTNIASTHAAVTVYAFIDQKSRAAEAAGISLNVVTNDI